MKIVKVLRNYKKLAFNCFKGKKICKGEDGSCKLAKVAIAKTAREQSILFEQYKLCVEMADRISSRREAYNSFYLILNSNIIVVSSYLLEKIGTSQLFIIIAAALGIIANMLWLATIKSFKKLNQAKFEVIFEIENQLIVPSYKLEWCKSEKGKHSTVTKVEVWIPKLFILFHIIYTSLHIFGIL